MSGAGLYSLLISSAVLVNTVLAFVLACAVIWPFSRLAPSASVRKWMLCAPLLKVFWDLSRGVPGNAYALSPFAGQRWELGSFQLGIGAKAPWSLLTLSGRLGARHGDSWFTLSGGDLPANALTHRGFAGLLLVIVAGVLLVGAGRLWRYFVDVIEHHRAEVVRRAKARVLDERRLGPWRVRVLEFRGDGPAHVAGLFVPAIWLPERASAWSAAHREAVLQHELSHIRHLDMFLFAALALSARALWFLPGIGWLERKIRGAAEEAADDAAVRRGVSPAELARAILLEGEQRAAGAFMGGRVVVARVRKLLDSSSRPRRFWRAVRVVLATYVVASVMLSSFFGYH